MNPSDVSATEAPPAEDWVTGPAFVLALLRVGTTGPLHVVNVGYDRKDLAAWYRVTMEHGALPGYQMADISVLNNHQGGIIELPAGESVAIGMMINHLSAP